MHLLKGSKFLQRMEEWEDPVESPQKIASDFICPMFKSEEDVLSGARHMVCIVRCI